jgi:hypothetical protein
MNWNFYGKNPGRPHGYQSNYFYPETGLQAINSVSGLFKEVQIDIDCMEIIYGLVAQSNRERDLQGN